MGGLRRGGCRHSIRCHGNCCHGKRYRGRARIASSERGCPIHRGSFEEFQPVLVRDQASLLVSFEDQRTLLVRAFFEHLLQRLFRGHRLPRYCFCRRKVAASRKTSDQLVNAVATPNDTDALDGIVYKNTRRPSAVMGGFLSGMLNELPPHSRQATSGPMERRPQRRRARALS